jgi:GNAT superfamily N-acetyltransferase
MTVPAVKIDAPERRAAHLKLYEATDALNIVHQFLEESEGELTPEIEELLAQAEGDFDAKAERVALFVREREAEAAAAKAQADAIKRIAVEPHLRRAATAERMVESLKEYLKRELIAAGGDEKTPRVVKGKTVKTIRLQKNSQPSVESTLTETDLARIAKGDDADLVKVQYVLDRAAAVARFNMGTPLPDGVKVKVGSHVRIS